MRLHVQSEGTAPQVLKRYFRIQGVHARLGRARHKRNRAWTPQHEGSVSEAWAYIPKQRRHAIIAYNIVMCFSDM
jgi:hypothetical protein